MRRTNGRLTEQAALTFRAAVDNPSRFARSRTVAAHFGLTPRRYQSGEMDNPGRISKAGDPQVRTALYAAANAMMMRAVASSGIKSWGLRLMRRKGRRRAVVAVARKLAVVMHLTCHGISPPVGTRVRPKEGTDDEANDTNRRADYRHLARA